MNDKGSSNGNKNGFAAAVTSMFDGIDHVVSSKTIVGDPIYVDGMTLIPLMEVSFAMGTPPAKCDRSVAFIIANDRSHVKGFSFFPRHPAPAQACTDYRTALVR